MTDRTTPDEATTAEERSEATTAHVPGELPDAGEERAAEEARDGLGEEVGEHYREMTERGANVKGEGSIP